MIYNDVGRTDIKMFRTRFEPAFEWMAEQNQNCIPGLEIPWGGPMSQWTKRDAFVFTDSDREDLWKSAPIQASFSVWRNTTETRTFVDDWCRACSDRRLVSNDANICGLPNMPDFTAHRHDQSVLSLLCRKAGIKALTYGDGSTPPHFPEKSLEAWMVFGGEQIPTTIVGLGLNVAAWVYYQVEQFFRKKFPRAPHHG